MRKRAYESQAVQLPKLRISGKMSDLSVALTPYTYCNFAQIHRLFYAEQTTMTSETVASNPDSLFKLRHKAAIKGLISRKENSENQDDHFFALLNDDKLLFYSAQNNQDSASLSRLTIDDEEDKVNEVMDRLFAERGFQISEGNEDRAPLKIFSLVGCSIIHSSQRSMTLCNSQREQCILSFKSAK